MKDFTTLQLDHVNTCYGLHLLLSKDSVRIAVLDKDIALFLLLQKLQKLTLIQASLAFFFTIITTTTTTTTTLVLTLEKKALYSHSL